MNKAISSPMTPVIWAKYPGRSLPSGLGISPSTRRLRVEWSTPAAIRVRVPLKLSPGSASTSDPQRQPDPCQTRIAFRNRGPQFEWIHDHYFEELRRCGQVLTRIDKALLHEPVYG